MLRNNSDYITRHPNASEPERDFLRIQYHALSIDAGGRAATLLGAGAFVALVVAATFAAIGH